MKKSSLLLFVCLMSCAPLAAPLVTPTAAPTVSATVSATTPPTVSPYARPSPPNTDEQNRVRSTSFDSEGFLWSVEPNNLIRWDLTKKMCVSYAPPSGWQAGSLYYVLSDKHDRLWISTTQGLWEFNQTQSEWVQHLSHLAGRIIAPLVLAPDGTLWAVGDKIYHFIGHEQSQIDKPSVNNVQYGIDGMAVTPDGDLWADVIEPSEGPIPKGIWRFDGHEWKVVSELAQDQHYLLGQVSDAGSLFVYSGGPEPKILAKKANETIWETVAEIDQRGVTKILVHDPTIWIVATSRLLRLEGNKLVSHPLPFEDYITSISVDDDTLCLGAQSQGVWCKINDEWHNYKTSEIICSTPQTMLSKE